MSMVVEEEVITTKKFKATGPDGKKLEASSIEQLEKLYAAEKEKWDKNQKKRDFRSLVDLIRENIIATLSKTYPIVTSHASEYENLFVQPVFYDSDESIFNEIIHTSPEIRIIFVDTSNAVKYITQNLRFSNLSPYLGKDMNEIQQKLKDHFLSEEFVELLYSSVSINKSKIKQIRFEDEDQEFDGAWDTATAKKYIKMLDQLSNNTEIVDKFNIILEDYKNKQEKSKKKKR